MVSQHYEPFKKLVLKTAAVDPAARTKKFDDKLMGELIRFVSSHEVGHTLDYVTIWELVLQLLLRN
jgi:ribosomal protein S18 acetylase RimI-like enzyme